MATQTDFNTITRLPSASYQYTQTVNPKRHKERRYKKTCVHESTIYAFIQTGCDACIKW